MEKTLFVKWALAALLVCGSVGFWASGAFSSSTSGPSSVTYKQPLILANEIDLNFGEFAGFGTVTVDTTVGNTIADATIHVITDGIRGKMTVNGEGGSFFTVQPDEPSVKLSGPGGNLTVELDVFTPTSVLSGVLGTTGFADVYIGGTLTVPPGTAPGAYTGIYKIEVNNS